MSPYRLGMIGCAGLAFIGSLGLWFFGDGFPRALEVLTLGGGKPIPPSISHPLYASLSGVLFAAGVGLACGAAIAASRTSALAASGRAALVAAGLIMAAGGLAVTLAMNQATSVMSIVAMSEVAVKPEEVHTAVAQLLPKMRFGLGALCLPPIGLLICGLIGFGPRATGQRAQVSWMHVISVTVAALLLAIVFAAAIPPALRLPEFFASTQPIKPFDVAASIQQVLSAGRLSGLLLVIQGLVILNLATLPGTPVPRAAT
jgi:hypothetical protein